jgi:uncharacterized protein YkwD
MKRYLTILVALLLAFGFTKVLFRFVFYPSAPVVRPSFVASANNAWNRLVIEYKKKTSIPPAKFIAQLPPPWLNPVKPTSPANHPLIPPVYSPTPPVANPTQPPTRPNYPSYPTSTPTPLQPSPTPTQSYQPPPPNSSAPSERAATLVSLINQERQKNGSTTLAFNQTLITAAQSHADDMANRNYFSHISPEGKTPADRAVAAGYPSRNVGENISKGYCCPIATFNGWMGSSGHRDNMLNPAWRSAGTGEATGGIWVLLLGGV